MATKKTVGIIGCGISGIVSLKSCLEEGLEPTCFEQFGKIGGVWYYTDEYRDGQGARAFENLTSNICKDMLAFSDFPYPDDDPPFLTCELVMKYLESYCDSFNLKKHIKLNTKVTKVEKSFDYEQTGRWDVFTEGRSGVEKHTFDFIMLCGGFFKKGYIPEIPGQDIFLGSFNHSIDYKNGSKYKGKTVLVLGNAHSSGDLSANVSNYAKQTYYGVGKGTYLIPRYGPKGRPFEFDVMRRCNFVTEAKANQVMTDFCMNAFDLKTAGLLPATPPSRSRAVINSEIQLRILNGKVKVVGQIKRLGPSEAEFEDGTRIENLDAVLYATGFESDIGVLRETLKAENGKTEFYKMIFPLKLKQNTLALVGYIHLEGSMPPAVELQARLIARVFAGKHQLPATEMMRKDVDTRNSFVMEVFGKYKYTLPYIAYKDELATELGVMPSPADLTDSPRLKHLFYNEPAFPYHYRLWGPHSWSGAEDAIEKALKDGYYAKQPRKIPDKCQWVQV